MEIMLVFLSTAIGTVAGVIVAALMMQRKIRVAGAGTDLALKTQLQNTEWALAAAGRDVEDLRKQLEAREQAVHQSREELERTQQQLASVAASIEKEAGARAAAESRVQALEAQAGELKRSTEEESGRKVEELTAQLAALTAQSAAEKQSVEAEKGRQMEELLAQFADRKHASEEETARQIAALEAEIASGHQKAEELTAKLAALAQQQHASEQETDRQIDALEAEIVNRGRQIADLTGQLADMQRTSEEVDVQISAERAAARRLATQVEELMAERVSLQEQLQKERQTAAEGMQLLQLVQSKLGGVPQSSGNGNGNGAVPHLVYVL